jgi:hypothetical protein
MIKTLIAMDIDGCLYNKRAAVLFTSALEQQSETLSGKKVHTHFGDFYKLWRDALFQSWDEIRLANTLSKLIASPKDKQIVVTSFSLRQTVDIDASNAFMSQGSIYKELEQYLDQSKMVQYTQCSAFLSTPVILGVFIAYLKNHQMDPKLDQTLTGTVSDSVNTRSKLYILDKIGKTLKPGDQLIVCDDKRSHLEEASYYMRGSMAYRPRKIEMTTVLVCPDKSINKIWQTFHRSIGSYTSLFNIQPNHFIWPEMVNHYELGGQVNLTLAKP